MEAHVEACPGCQGVLERLAADSSAWAMPEPELRPRREQPPTIPGFVIERELGRGGMGVVYQAWQPQLGRRVAIKVVGARVGIGADDRRRWLNEALAIGRVRHRNIVPIHEAGEHDGSLYLVLDLIPGGSLAERALGPLAPRVAAGLMATVARAVEHLHRAGLLHLDVKPSNILLDGPPDGGWDQATPMITDLGIARTGDGPAGPAGIGGTPSYMAPEQVSGDGCSIGPHSDVFALGATLYTLLTGRSPFQGASVIETLELMRSREPASPRALVPGVPRDLETIAMTCLLKDPGRRYPTAVALAEDLERWLGGFPIRARPVSKLEHVRRWCGRRPALASLAAVLSFTIVLSLAGLLTLWRRSEAQRVRAENALARAVASDRATSGAVRQLIGLLRSIVDSPQILSSERLERSARAVLDLTAKLRRERGLSASNLVAICELERGLADEFRLRGRFPEARAVLVDSLDLLGVQRRTASAADAEVDHACARAWWELGTLATAEGRPDEALGSFRSAEAVLEHLVRGPRHSEAAFWLDASRRAIADLLGPGGPDGPGRALLESHGRMLEQLSKQSGSDPGFGFLAADLRADLVADADAASLIRAAIERFPVGQPLPARFQRRAAQWIAANVERSICHPQHRAGRAASFDADAHAAAVIRALDAGNESLGLGREGFAAAALAFSHLAAYSGARDRKADHLDEARRTAACLSAVGRALVARDPAEAAFHTVMSSGYQQEAKNAWQIPDHALIEDRLRKALRSAYTALRLQPGDPMARLNVATLQDKLAELAANPPRSR